MSSELELLSADQQALIVRLAKLLEVGTEHLHSRLSPPPLDGLDLEWIPTRALFVELGILEDITTNY